MAGLILCVWPRDSLLGSLLAVRLLVPTAPMKRVATAPAHEYPVAQEATSQDGRRWRKCAAAAIVNSAGHIFVGERCKIPGAWNCPQGGMDAASKEHGGPETVLEAAAREAYEECGLRLGEHITPIAAMETDEQAVRYEAGGWLKGAGFAGQQLHWALFDCCSALGEQLPDAITVLDGLDGEAAEFRCVRWQPLADVIAGMWPAKRGPYEALMEWSRPILQARVAAQTAIDFTGTWRRDSSLSVGLVEALQQRNLSDEQARDAASAPYVQRWLRGSKPGAWLVATYAADGVTPRREIEYALGDVSARSRTSFGRDALDRPTPFLRSPGTCPAPTSRVQMRDCIAAVGGGLRGRLHSLWSGQ